MIIPQDILDEIRERTSISQVIASKVSWDKKKTNFSRGDLWASCPFHSEKTASFHVDEVKGYYYCFGCHKKGDVITFKMEAENFSFIEAVKILADESGIPLPKQNSSVPIEKNQHVRKVLSESDIFYRNQLQSDAAIKVREYLYSRNLGETEITDFDLGFAPKGAGALVNYLTRKGYNEETIIESGMALQSNRSARLYDRFQNRLIFPINDYRGRTIAFGGRALTTEQNAKYLNSPETPVFSKGSNLYNFPKARANYTKETHLIVVEGYMDVISLSKFGFKSCVAPLGTAVTTKQLELLWKISSEPIIIMDGDIAGLRAANKLIEILLPLIQFDKTARFCFLPEGKDPDDFVNEQGSEAFKNLISKSISLSECIWNRETKNVVFDSPERISALNNKLQLLTGKISDKNLRSEYFNYFQKVKKEFFSVTTHESRQKFRDYKTFGNKKFDRNWIHSFKKSKPTTETINSPVAKKSLKIKNGFEQLTHNLIQLECFLLAFIIFNPNVDKKIFGRFRDTEYNTHSLKLLKRNFLAYHFSDGKNGTQDNTSKLNGLKDHLQKSFKEILGKNIDEKFYQRENLDLIRTLEELLIKQEHSKSLLDEFKEATEEIDGIADESLTKRLKEAHQAFRNLSKTLNYSDINSDEGFKKNSELLKKFIDDKIWKKT